MLLLNDNYLSIIEINVKKLIKILVIIKNMKKKTIFIFGICGQDG